MGSVNDYLSEPKIEPDQILIVDDSDFRPEHVCLVTGAGTGIGRASALAAAANGLTVLGLDINTAEGTNTGAMAGEIAGATGRGGGMVFRECDLTDDGQVQEAVDAAAGLGRIKYLINIAGMQHTAPVEDFPMEVYDKMQKLMLRAPLLLSKLCIPHMRASRDGAGVIGNMASIHAHVSTKNKVAYNITKFGLRALSQSISAEGEGLIRSFTVSTGYVKTPLALNQIPAQAEQLGLTPEEVISQVMMSRSRTREMMTPIEAAGGFIYGMSRFGKYLVGGDLLLDGGLVKTY